MISYMVKLKWEGTPSVKVENRLSRDLFCKCTDKELKSQIPVEERKYGTFSSWIKKVYSCVWVLPRVTRMGQEGYTNTVFNQLSVINKIHY